MTANAACKTRSRSRRTLVQCIAYSLGFLLLLSGTSVFVLAQVETGKIVGSVKDASGAVVTNAAITVTAIQTNVQKKTQSNENGDYVVTELKSGEYTVTVEHAGFKKAVQAAFKLDAAETEFLEMELPELYSSAS